MLEGLVFLEVSLRQAPKQNVCAGYAVKLQDKFPSSNLNAIPMCLLCEHSRTTSTYYTKTDHLFNLPLNTTDEAREKFPYFDSDMAQFSKVIQ